MAGTSGQGQWLSGGQFLGYIQRRRLPTEQEAAMISRTSPALELLHSKGDVHGDFKPEDVLRVYNDCQVLFCASMLAVYYR